MNSPEDIPLQITPEQARAAIRALGIQDHIGVFEVTICIGEVILKRTAHDEDGQPIMCRGGFTYQTISVPVAEKGTE